MEFARSFVGELAAGDIGLCETAALFVALEFFFLRRGAKVSLGSRLKAIVFWNVYGVIVGLMAHGLALLWAPLGVRPLLSGLALPGLPPAAAAAVGALAAAYLGDLVYYWCHRIQHRFFWRFHAVHHSVRDMNGLTAYHHVSEQLFQFALYSAPLSLLIDSPYALPVFGSLLALQGNYLHSPIRLNFGPLGRYFVDNRFHRIHHSLQPEHFDKNFGLFTTLWDVVFGTAYFPARDEWPQTGVADTPEPATVAEFLTSPFVARKPAVNAAELGDSLPELA
jgi:sterol desaturase/sphingolipid hydroxylase (fatty acid hydroxylase superfamily)